MKNRIFIFQPILICATIIMFNACFSQWKGEDAVLVINLGRITGNRAALPWPPNGDNGFLDQIVFNVELTGPGGTIHITGKKHGESIRAAVLPGRWSVAVEAFLDSIVYAKGRDSVNVTGGQNNSVAIQMRQVDLTQGDGSPERPFLVYDVDTLRQLGSGTDGWDMDKHYRQIIDITLPPDLSPSGNWTPKGVYISGGNTGNIPFEGTFNGNGKTISGLCFDNASDWQGLFRYIGSGGTVKNLTLVEVNIKGGQGIGAVAGVSIGTVENCYVNGTVQGIWAGSIVGRNFGTVQNCYSEGSVISSGEPVGGIVGINDISTPPPVVRNCYTLVNVSGQNVGGVAGNNFAGSIENCVALNLSITATESCGRIAEGIGSFINNYAQTGMTLTSGTGSSTPSGTAGDKDGEDVSAGTNPGEYNNRYFWEKTLGWDFSGIWKWGGNNLPALR